MDRFQINAHFFFDFASSGFFSGFAGRDVTLNEIPILIAQIFLKLHANFILIVHDHRKNGSRKSVKIITIAGFAERNHAIIPRGMIDEF